MQTCKPTNSGCTGHSLQCFSMFAHHLGPNLYVESACHIHTQFMYIYNILLYVYIYTYIISPLASFSCPQWNVQERSKDGGRSAVRPEMAASANAVPLQGRIPPKLQRMPKGVMSPENVAK